MNQEKIGKFIQELRKQQNLTQLQLAEKLGVTDRAVSKWENGRCMPDLSLFIPLSQELGITINELLSGERLTEEKYQQKLEENFIIHFATMKKKIGKIFFVLKVGVIVICITILMSLLSFVVGHTLFTEYWDTKIPLLQDEFQVTVCQYREDFLLLDVEALDGFHVNGLIEDQTKTELKMTFYRTRKERKDKNQLDDHGFGTLLIPSQIKSIYANGMLVWDSSFPTNACEDSHE